MKKLILICAALLLSACGGGGGGDGSVIMPTPAPVPSPPIDPFFTLTGSVVANTPDDTAPGDLSGIPVVEPDTTEATEL